MLEQESLPAVTRWKPGAYMPKYIPDLSGKPTGSEQHLLAKALQFLSVVCHVPHGLSPLITASPMLIALPRLGRSRDDRSGPKK